MAGFQLGYQYSKVSKAELGLNLYHCWQNLSDHFHVLGPYAVATGMSLDKTFYIGQQYGINYHFAPMENFVECYRICLGYENNRLGDHRIGGDIGMSVLGLFVFAGYYAPVSTYENKNISRFRFGIRFVFNGAPVEEMVDF